MSLKNWSWKMANSKTNEHFPSQGIDTAHPEMYFYGITLGVGLTNFPENCLKVKKIPGWTQKTIFLYKKKNVYLNRDLLPTRTLGNSNKMQIVFVFPKENYALMNVSSSFRDEHFSATIQPRKLSLWDYLLKFLSKY